MHSPCLKPSLFPRRLLQFFQWFLPVLAGHLTAATALAIPDIRITYQNTEITTGYSANFGSVNVGATASKSFTLANVGDTTLASIAFSFTGAATGDYSVTPATTSLGPGGSFNFTITFRPTQALARTAALRIASNDLNENPTLINLTGIGTAPEITVTAPTVLTDGVSTVNFGKVKVGLTGNRIVAIKNVGNSPLTNLSVSVSGSDFSVSALPVSSLAANQTTNVTLSFTPSSISTSNGSLRIFSNDPDESPFDINITGSGVIPLLEVESPIGTPVFDGSDTALNSPVGVQINRPFLLRNVSTGTLTGLALSLDGNDAANFSAGTLPGTTLAPGATMTFTVSFTPQDIITYSANLHIAFDQSGGSPFDILLIGNGVTLPDDGDEDGDGLLNMLETAMGTDPLTPNFDPGILTKNGANLEFVITRSVSAQVTYNLWVEYSDDSAGAWTPLDTSFAFLENQVGDVQTLRYIFPAGDSGHRFARIRATKL